MSAIPIHSPTTILVASAAADLRAIQTATSAGFATADALGRMELAAQRLSIQARELRIHARAIRADHRRAERGRAAA